LVTQTRSAFLEKCVFEALRAQNYFFHNVSGVLRVARLVARAGECSARNNLGGEVKADQG
jgi:hypothetical protein